MHIKIAIANVPSPNNVRSNIIDAEDEQPDEDDELDSIYLDDT